MDLRLIISVDAEDAKQELAAVEGGIQKVEATSQKASPSVKAVVDAITGQGQAAKSTTEAQAKLSEVTDQLTGTTHRHKLALNASKEETLAYVKALIAEDAAAARARESTQALTGATVTATSAAANARVATMAWAAALFALAAAAGLVLKFLFDSTRAYVEQSGILERHQRAIEGIKDAWSDMFVSVGQAIVGSGADITGFLHGIEQAIRVTTDRIEDEIARAKAWIDVVRELRSLMPGADPRDTANTVGGFFGLALTPGDAPTPQNASFFMNEEGELQQTAFGRMLETGQRTVDVLSAQVKGQTDAFVAGLERRSAETIAQIMRAADEARREAERWQKLLDSLSGRTAIADAQELMRAIADVGGATKISADDQERYNRALTDGLDAMRRLNRDGTAPMIAMLREWVALQRANFAGPGIIPQMGAETLANATLTTLLRQQVQETVGVLGVPGTMGPQLILQPVELIPELSDQTLQQNLPHIVDSLTNPFREAFKRVGDELPDLLFQALAGGGPIVSSIAAGLGAIFASEFQRAVANLPRDAQGRPILSALTPGQQALGVVGMGLSSFVGGFQMGASTNRTTGALAGAGQGFLQGAALGSVVPGIGTVAGGLIGAGIGLFGGLLGGGKAEQERRAQLEQNRQAMIQQFGGLENLTRLTDQLGVSMDRAFDTDNPREFEFHVMMLNNALAEMNRRIATINRLTTSGQLATPEELRDIVRTRGTDEEIEALKGFLLRQTDTTASGLTLLTENAPLASAESVSGAASALAVLGQQMVDMGLDATAIAERLLPILDKLETRMQELGVEGGEAFDEIAAHIRLFTDEAARPSIDAITGVVQTLTGLNNMGLLNQEMFGGLARNIVEVRDSLIDQGFSAEQAFAIIRPGLQEIWELQQDFGYEVDATTQALIDQGLEAGTVGERFRDPMRQMIDAVNRLVLRLEDFLEALGLIGPEAEEQRDRANRAFDGITFPDDRPRDDDDFEDRGPRGSDRGDDLGNAHTGGFLLGGQAFPFFHDGGHIDARAWRIAHTGGLAPDEFPIIAQDGEFMFRRPAVQFWGRDTLRDMNDLRTPLRSTVTSDVPTVPVRQEMRIIIERDGEREAEWLVPFIAGEAQRLRQA